MADKNKPLERTEPKALVIHDVSKFVNCKHPMDSRADVHNSRETYCLKCSTFI